MKTLYSVALVLLISTSYCAKKINKTDSENKLIAIFKGTTDDYLYKFIDDKNIEHLFYDVYEPEIADDESEENIKKNTIDLTNDKYIDKKFELTWSFKDIDELDEEGEETGKKVKVKTILTLKVIK
jgi:hypothetical protein